MLRLTRKGQMATLTYSTLGPLEAPVNPSLFGIERERRIGIVTRQIGYRVRVFD